ncbi:hypothetical protein L1887_53091 [Cichorium endivia]|nr:hypothetical protein L1887_53091 [Cichorium endivia]
MRHVVREDDAVDLVVVVLAIDQKHLLSACGGRSDDEDEDALAVRLFAHPVVFGLEEVDRGLFKRNGLGAGEAHVWNFAKVAHMLTEKRELLRILDLAAGYLWHAGSVTERSHAG